MSVLAERVVTQLPALVAQQRTLTVGDVRDHVNLIQSVMKAVMQKDTHYGVIPGCKQPSLYKSGSEVLLATFRIAISVQVEDLSDADCIRYRVRTIGTHQTTGVVVGEGIGECSSNETKYKWRACYVKKEFENTPESRRRIKYKSYQGKDSEQMEVRTDPADVANTILKMAKKRAQIDLTLTATAASDIFTQDIEDLPEELRGEEHAPPPAPAKAAYSKEAFDKNRATWGELVTSGKKTPDQIIAMLQSKATLTPEQEGQIRALGANAGAKADDEAPY